MRACTLLIAAALTFAGQAGAQTRLAAYHEGLPAAEFDAAVRTQELSDQAECRDQVRHDAGGSFLVTARAPSLGGAFATAVVAGVVAGAVMGATENYRDASSVKGCMAKRGYTPVDLTPAQTAEVKALPRSERDKWMERTPQFAPKPASDTFAVMMWDVAMNRPVSVHRDPATGDYVRTWTFNR